LDGLTIFPRLLTLFLSCFFNCLPHHSAMFDKHLPLNKRARMDSGTFTTLSGKSTPIRPQKSEGASMLLGMAAFLANQNNAGAAEASTVVSRVLLSGGGVLFEGGAMVADLLLFFLPDHFLTDFKHRCVHRRRKEWCERVDQEWRKDVGGRGIFSVLGWSSLVVYRDREQPRWFAGVGGLLRNQLRWCG
tara:strand:- start:240 stop:806 length:567 start_codon:yes stop_codon:yes gene_type:complete